MSFEIIYNKALKIFSQLYVGVKTPHPGSPAEKAPLAFATPYEDNAAGRKRQETVKTWVGHRHSVYNEATKKWDQVEYQPDLRIIANDALEGFKITDDVKRVYWGGGNVVWRVEDPRGWELEIQSNNLMALIQTQGIQAGGVINGKCIWARDGATNILIPETSQEYKDAIKAAETARAPSKIPAKDRKVGAVYRLADGDYGTYLGKVTVFYGKQEDDGKRISNIIRLDDGRLCAVASGAPVNQTVDGVDVFEAVMISTQYYDGRHSVRLYKNASLIELLDDKSMDESAVEKVLSASRNAFASSRDVSPLTVSVAKLGMDDVEWVFQPLDKKHPQVVRARSNLKDHIKNHAQHYSELLKRHNQAKDQFKSSNPHPGELRFDLTTVIDAHGELFYQHDDAIAYGFTRQVDTYNSIFGERISARYMVPLHFSGLEWRAYPGELYHNRYHGAAAKGDGVVTTLSLPKFATEQEALAAFDALVAGEKLGQLKLVKK